MSNKEQTTDQVGNIDISKLNLFERIQLVTQEIKILEKNLQVGTDKYGYKAVSDAEVVQRVNIAENKFGLVSFALKQELLSSDILRTQEGERHKVQFYCLLKITTRIMMRDITEAIPIENVHYIDVETHAVGLDSGDKGTGKASTYGRKYGLMMGYKLASGEEIDIDKSKDIYAEITPDEQRKNVVDFLLKNTTYYGEVCKSLGVTTHEELSEKDVKTIYDSLNRRGVWHS